MTGPFLLVEFPAGENHALHWWRVEGTGVTASGVEHDPLESAGFLADTGNNLPQIIALVRSADAVVRWHDCDDQLTEKQRLASAMVMERENSLDPETAHFAALAGGEDLVATASMNRDVLSTGLVHLQTIGIDPDAIVPAGWIVGPEGENFVRADVGFESLIRGGRVIVPDEPVLREQLVGDREIVDLPPEDIEAALASFCDAPLLNLRSGIFAKKKPRASMTDVQKRVLGWMAAAVLVISIAIPLIQWLKYDMAADDADEAALAAATSVLGPIKNLDAAERELDQRLIARSRGYSVFSVPASALFSALQKAPAVTLTAISYRGDGTASATLSAVRNEEINPVLLDLQTAGFRVTATPRTDATGMARAEINVRAP